MYTRHAWISIAISILYILCISAHAQFCSHSHLPRGFRLSARVSFVLDSRTTFVQTVRLFTSLRIQRKHGLKAEPPRALLNEPIHTLQIKITRFTDGFRLNRSVYTVFPRIVSFFASNGAIIWNFAPARRLFEILLRLASHALNILFVCLFFFPLRTMPNIVTSGCYCTHFQFVLQDYGKPNGIWQQVGGVFPVDISVTNGYSGWRI